MLLVNRNINVMQGAWMAWPGLDVFRKGGLLTSRPVRGKTNRLAVRLRFVSVNILLNHREYFWLRPWLQAEFSFRVQNVRITDFVGSWGLGLEYLPQDEELGTYQEEEEKSGWREALKNKKTFFCDKCDTVGGGKTDQSIGWD